MSAQVKQFSVAAALRLRDFVLANPPASPFTKRPEPRGELVYQCALPLELCPTTNATRHAQALALAKTKRRLGELMLAQAGGRRAARVLAGRPQVIARRLSSVQPDKYSNWSKMAVDKLCVGPNRLGFLVNDREKDIELYEVWEPGPQGGGCVVLELRTGHH